MLFRFLYWASTIIGFSAPKDQESHLFCIVFLSVRLGHKSLRTLMKRSSSWYLPGGRYGLRNWPLHLKKVLSIYFFINSFCGTLQTSIPFACRLSDSRSEQAKGKWHRSLKRTTKWVYKKIYVGQFLPYDPQAPISRFLSNGKKHIGAYRAVG